MSSSFSLLRHASDRARAVAQELLRSLPLQYIYIYREREREREERERV